MKEKLFKILEACNSNLIDAETAQVQVLDLFGVSGSLPSESEIQKYIDDQPYYGTCTTEYKEGIEQGIKWILDRLKATSNDR